ncbi:MAG TPA: hypothetical protein VLQ80_08600 [Candidatus Saccharimonadia bacterium]|nr:hypothetical protein [Candidatus Saccharimonadia bacterium]
MLEILRTGTTFGLFLKPQPEVVDQALGLVGESNTGDPPVSCRG